MKEPPKSLFGQQQQHDEAKIFNSNTHHNKRRSRASKRRCNNLVQVPNHSWHRRRPTSKTKLQPSTTSKYSWSDIQSTYEYTLRIIAKQHRNKSKRTCEDNHIEKWQNSGAELGVHYRNNASEGHWWRRCRELEKDQPEHDEISWMFDQPTDVLMIQRIRQNL